MLNLYVWQNWVTEYYVAWIIEPMSINFQDWICMKEKKTPLEALFLELSNIYMSQDIKSAS
jgi:hypothetical protein